MGCQKEYEMIINLDHDFPEDDYIEFKTKSGKEYKIQITIPIDAGMTIIDNFDILQKIFPADGGRVKPSREAFELILKITVDICHAQYEEIDRDWLRENISLPRLIYIVYKMARPIYEFLTASGFVQGA